VAATHAPGMEVMAGHRGLPARTSATPWVESAS
jgi:hypothetical protein